VNLVTTLETTFPRRTMTTTLVAGGIITFFGLQYLPAPQTLGFLVGLLLGVLHLWSWTVLGRHLVGDRPPGPMAAVTGLKLVVIYGGTAGFLYLLPQTAVAYLVGFTFVFFVMIQKLLGRKLIEHLNVRSAS
jgi:hypothetical protein